MKDRWQVKQQKYEPKDGFTLPVLPFCIFVFLNRNIPNQNPRRYVPLFILLINNLGYAPLAWKTDAYSSMYQGFGQA